MDWFWAILFLVGVAQLTCGRDTIPAIRPSHLVRRNIVARSPSVDAQRNNDVSDELFPERVLYHLRDDLRSPHSASSGGSMSYGNGQPSSDNLGVDNYLANEPDGSYQRGFGSDDSPFLFSDSSLERNLAEEWASSADGNNGRTATDNNNNVQNNNNNNNSNDNGGNLSPLNADERVMLQKRLKMKGMGLLGSSRGSSSLVGLSKSRPKGLVLSIDLGIKALRDAIKHAKYQQKNRQHKIQVQKNLRLLHDIGKRRAPESSNLDSP